MEELFLLARAEAGERPPLNEAVELDGLALECADLMRGRAQALGCRLELSRVEPVVLKGSEPLLREALLELLENACRHGSPAQPVRISVYLEGREAVLEVSNAIDAATHDGGDISRGSGLGMRVAWWIASEHGGRLLQQRTGGTVVTAFRVALPEGSDPPS